MEATTISKVCFVCCHPAPSAHFVDFTTQLKKAGISYDVHAADSAYKVFSERGVQARNFSKIQSTLSQLNETELEVLSEEVAKAVSVAKCVIVDVGSTFSAQVLCALKEKFPKVIRIGYYENPEKFVPGGFSEAVKKVAGQAQILLFANANLENMPIYATATEMIDITCLKRIGLGYSNLEKETEILKGLRTSSDRIVKRKEFLQSHGIFDDSKKIAVYFGGANDVYYNQAFPHFLDILEKSIGSKALSEVVIVIQQHPRAKDEGNKDALLFQKWLEKQNEVSAVLSKVVSDDVAAVTDLAMYYQTGMNAKLYLSFIPILQVGHIPFSDLLVRNGLCNSVTTAESFEEKIDTLLQEKPQVDEEKVYKELGVRKDWQDVLVHLVTSTGVKE